MKTVLRNAFLFVILFFFLLVSFQVSLSFCAEMPESDEDDAADIEESIEITTPRGQVDPINFDIFEDIARGRAKLEKERCGFKVVRTKTVRKVKKGKRWKTITTYGKPELGEFTILLALENVRTREIKIARVHPRLGGRSGGAIIEPGKLNGVNTKFTITSQEHHVVLALKRPVRQGGSFREVIYTPYSDGIDIPAVRQAGMDYLKTTITSARNDLLRRRVRPVSSNTFIDTDISVVLAIIEHIDPGKFVSGRYTTEKLINETLVILGTNRHNAYRFSRSPAGAMGLFQFIPGTYKRVRTLYPQAVLHPDFTTGMADHLNAAKASFLLFDADLNVLSDARRQQLFSDPSALGRFLASAYNCGPGRTRNSMDRHGERWASAVPAETQIYLNKFDAVLKWYRTEALMYR